MTDGVWQDPAPWREDCGVKFKKQQQSEWRWWEVDNRWKDDASVVFLSWTVYHIYIYNTSLISSQLKRSAFDYIFSLCLQGYFEIVPSQDKNYSYKHF